MTYPNTLHWCFRSEVGLTHAKTTTTTKNGDAANDGILPERIKGLQRRFPGENGHQLEIRPGTDIRKSKDNNPRNDDCESSQNRRTV
jgi:hypothetical protein